MESKGNSANFYAFCMSVLHANICLCIHATCDGLWDSYKCFFQSINAYNFWSWDQKMAPSLSLYKVPHFISLCFCPRKNAIQFVIYAKFFNMPNKQSTKFVFGNFKLHSFFLDINIRLISYIHIFLTVEDFFLLTIQF